MIIFFTVVSTAQERRVFYCHHHGLDVVLETLFERQLAKANHEQQKNADGIAQREAVPAAAEDDGGFSAFGAGDDDGGFSAFGNEDQDSASSSRAAPARAQSKEKPGIVKIRDSQVVCLARWFSIKRRVQFCWVELAMVARGKHAAALRIGLVLSVWVYDTTLR